MPRVVDRQPEVGSIECADVRLGISGMENKLPVYSRCSIRSRCQLCAMLEASFLQTGKRYRKQRRQLSKR